MLNICVIFTGGTIGSKINKNVIDTSENQKYFLLNKYYEFDKSQDVVFETISAMNTLSENLNFDKWEKIIELIKKQLNKNYDGIILTHGTDTLAYTSCMLAMVFNNINIPLVIVSSNRPLEDKSGNGFDNFVGAIDFIKSRNFNGVFTIYKDKYANMNIHLGSRVTQANQILGEVYSANEVNFGQIVNHEFIYNNNKLNPKLDKNQEINDLQISSNIKFCNDFMLIVPYVGMNYDYFMDGKKPKFILHTLYHSGTACSIGENTSLINFANYCKINNIDLYLAPIDFYQKNMYQSSQIILKSNVKLLKGISIEASLVKLMLAYGSFKTNKLISMFLEKDLANEFIK